MRAQGSEVLESIAERELVFTRFFDAPRSLVWDAWTDPAQVVQWWGPRGFTSTVEEIDVRPGGVWRMVLHGPDGTDYPNEHVYQEVVPLERIVHQHHASMGRKKAGSRLWNGWRSISHDDGKMADGLRGVEGRRRLIWLH